MAPALSACHAWRGAPALRSSSVTPLTVNPIKLTKTHYQTIPSEEDGRKDPARCWIEQIGSEYL